MATGRVLKLKDVRLAFTQNLFVAGSYKNEPGKKKKFKAKFLIRKDHPQIQEVKDELSRLATEVWKDRAGQVLQSIQNNAQKFAFGDGDLSPYEGFAGHYSISASNETMPLYLRSNPGTKEKPNVIPPESGELYGGCYVVAHLSFWTWDKTGPQINCNLLGAQFFRPGEAFSGGGTASIDEFEAVGDGIVAPTAANTPAGVVDPAAFL